MKFVPPLNAAILLLVTSTGAAAQDLVGGTTTQLGQITGALEQGLTDLIYPDDPGSLLPGVVDTVGGTLDSTTDTLGNALSRTSSALISSELVTALTTPVDGVVSDLPGGELLRDVSLTDDLLQVAGGLLSDVVDPSLLIGDDGRSMIDMGVEDLDEELKQRAKQSQCRLMGGAGGLQFDFSSVDSQRVYQANERLLVACPKGVSFQLQVVQDGLPANSITAQIYDAADEQVNRGQVQFYTAKNTPLNNAQFSGDGEPQAVMIQAVFTSDGQAHSKSGAIKLDKPVDLVLVAQ